MEGYYNLTDGSGWSPERLHSYDYKHNNGTIFDKESITHTLPLYR